MQLFNVAVCNVQTLANPAISRLAFSYFVLQTRSKLSVLAVIREERKKENYREAGNTTLSSNVTFMAQQQFVETAQSFLKNHVANTYICDVT